MQKLYYGLTQQTLSDYKLYGSAINLFKKSIKKYDSLFSATILKNHFWDQNKLPLNHDPFAKKHIVAKNLNQFFHKMVVFL